MGEEGRNETRVGETAELRRPLDDSAWNEELKVLAEFVSRERDRARQLASRIAEGIASLDPVMSRWCDATCPDCADPCCEGRAVFFNRTDLLVLLASGLTPPPGQTRQAPGQPCRYLSPRGCTLSRWHRPYVCVWFICERQMELFSEERPAFQRAFIRALESIRSLRIELETLCD